MRPKELYLHVLRKLDESTKINQNTLILKNLLQ